MNLVESIISSLHRLNELQVEPKAAWAGHLSPGERAHEIERLRALLPATVLGHHDRMVARGKRSLAMVSGGVCGACRLQLPVGHRIGRSNDLDVCDNCGVFLEWPRARGMGSPFCGPAVPNADAA